MRASLAVARREHNASARVMSSEVETSLDMSEIVRNRSLIWDATRDSRYFVSDHNRDVTLRLDSSPEFCGAAVRPFANLCSILSAPTKSGLRLLGSAQRLLSTAFEH